MPCSIASRSGNSHAVSTPMVHCALSFTDDCSLMNDATMDAPQTTPDIKERLRKAKPAGVTLAYRLAVASRIVAALLGGYLVAALTSVCISQWVPMPRADAVVTGMMLSFVAYLLVVIWCFACRTAWRAWAGVLLPAAILAAVFGLGRWLS